VEENALVRALVPASELKKLDEQFGLHHPRATGRLF
jgi:hypothetical protein